MTGTTLVRVKLERRGPEIRPQDLASAGMGQPNPSAKKSLQGARTHLYNNKTTEIHCYRGKNGTLHQESLQATYDACHGVE
jgi:hypothetical protein